MQKEELQQKIAEYYAKLPPKVQEIFSSMAWLETLKIICLKHSLDDKQKETLGTETTLVLLGIIHLDEYQEILTKELAIPKDSIEHILKEINEVVINPIRPELLGAFNANVQSLANQKPIIETKLDERFKKLPKDVENIVQESNYQATLYEIGQEYKFNVEEMGVLDKVVAELITGAIHPDAFEDSLQGNLKLPIDKTRELANAINERILRGIREKTKELNKPKVVKITLDRAKPIEPPRVITLKDIVGEKKEVLLVPDLPAVPSAQLMQVGKLELETAHPILAQKLSSSFQIPKVETNHSLSNLSKTTPLKIDPYRELPE